MIRLFDVAMMADASRRYWVSVEVDKQTYVTVCNNMDAEGLREMGIDSLDFDVEVVDIFDSNPLTLITIKTSEKNMRYLCRYYSQGKWMV